MPKGEILAPELTITDFIPEGPIKIGAVRAHHIIQRKPGYPTSGMTYGGLHNTAEEAEVERQVRAGKYRNSARWSRQKKISTEPEITSKQTQQAAEEWLDSTEVIFMNVREEFLPCDHFPVANELIHGINDGTHGSEKSWKE